MVEPDTKPGIGETKKLLLALIVIPAILAVVASTAEAIRRHHERTRIAAMFDAAEHSTERCTSLAHIYAAFRTVEEEARIEGKSWSETDRMLFVFDGCPAGLVAREVAMKTANLAATELLRSEKERAKGRP